VDSFQALRLRSVFLLFHSGDGEQFTLGEVHLWDGARRLHAFPARNIRGALLEKGQQNTFVLDQPQKISAGLGLSFSLTKGSGLATRPFLLAGAGAEFETWVETALSAPPRLRLLGG
jgi:hypothetical protein